MSKQYPSGIISKTAVIPSGPYENSSASGIWTLDQQAYWNKQGLWPIAGNATDPYFENVTMLLHGDGTNAAQNNTFVDSSTNNFTITRNGNTTQGTFSPYGSNWSNYFSGSGNSLGYASATQYAIGTGNFTVEFLVNFSSLNAGHNRMFCIGASGTDGLEIDLNGTTLEVGIQNGYPISYTWTPTVGTWYYMAVTRSGSAVTLYINGTSVATGTSSNSISQNSLNIGGISWVGSWSINGYISNVRLSNTVRTITTPTVPYTTDGNTLFLGSQSNRFSDNSSYAATATLTGSPSVQRFSPFSPTTAYSTSVIGGSGYFGSGNYISAASNAAFALGTGDFTVEAWVYPTSAYTTYNYVLGVAVTNGLVFYVTGGNLVVRSFNGSDLLSSSTIPALNTWTHVAATRSGTTLRIFVNGVQTASTTNSTNFAQGSAVVGNDGTNAAPWYGYITDLRLVKGTAVYTSAFTPPTAPLTAITNTSLLTNFTNAGILDNAMMNDLETVGNAQISTSVKKYGTGSMYFDGTGDYLSKQNPPIYLINWWQGSYTIEYWIYANAFTQGAQNDPVIIGNMDASSSSNYWSFGPITSGVVRFYYYNGSGQAVQTTTTLSTGQWYHLAFVNNNGSLAIYINGVSSATGSVSGTPQSSSSIPLTIGSTNSASFNGYIDDLRITKGVARYTATFTPPTKAFSDL
jgi:hypothetical protein